MTRFGSGRKHASVAEVADKVKEVLDDQSRRWQVLKLSEAAALGAVATARVLHEGSNDTAVNRRTRITDQKRAMVAADLKRVMQGSARGRLRQQQMSQRHTG